MPTLDDPPETDAAPGSMWAAVVDGVKGRQQDCTTGRLRYAIVALAIPMMLEMVLESVFAVVDIFFVAKLGAAAIATVGFTESMMSMLYAIAIGLSIATTATVARRMGEGNPEKASVAAVQAIFLGLGLAIVIGAIGILFPTKLLAAMGADAEVIEIGSGYTAIMIGGNVAVFLLFLLNAIFRGAGDAAVAMRSLWLANGINIVLDPCLIFGLGPFPEMGLEGAATATCCGRGIGVLYQLKILAGGTARIHVPWGSWKFVPAVTRRLTRVSIGGIGQFLIGTASWIGLMRIASQFGKEAVAGYTLSIRIVLFALLPAWGLSNAAATLVGQNLGAGKPDRSERSVWWTGLYNMIFLGLVSLVFLSFGDKIVDLFLQQSRDGLVELANGEDLHEVRDVASNSLRIISYGYVFFAWGMVAVQSFNGAGDTTTPTWINFFCFWLFQIPMAWLLSHHTALGINGVFWAIAVAYSVSAMVGVVWFRRGAWKNRTV